jgi:hypothetical protein
MFLERAGTAYAASSFLSLQNEGTDSGWGGNWGDEAVGS